jgi:hypothetical protein
MKNFLLGFVTATVIWLVVFANLHEQLLQVFSNFSGH